MGQTVNLLAYAFGGSNPSLPTNRNFFCGIIVQAERKSSLLEFAEAQPMMPRLNFQFNRGSSSVDRALAFQAEGRGFEPRLPLSINISRLAVN